MVRCITLNGSPPSGLPWCCQQLVGWRGDLVQHVVSLVYATLRQRRAKMPPKTESGCAGFSGAEGWLLQCVHRGTWDISLTEWCFGVHDLSSHFSLKAPRGAYPPWNSTALPVPVTVEDRAIRAITKNNGGAEVAGKSPGNDPCVASMVDGNACVGQVRQPRCERMRAGTIRGIQCGE